MPFLILEAMEPFLKRILLNIGYFQLSLSFHLSVLPVFGRIPVG